MGKQLQLPGDRPPAQVTAGHTRLYRRTNTRRPITSLEMTVAERNLLEELATEMGIPRGEVLRRGLALIAAQQRADSDTTETHLT